MSNYALQTKRLINNDISQLVSVFLNNTTMSESLVRPLMLSYSNMLIQADKSTDVSNAATVIGFFKSEGIYGNSSVSNANMLITAVNRTTKEKTAFSLSNVLISNFISKVNTYINNIYSLSITDFYIVGCNIVLE